MYPPRTSVVIKEFGGPSPNGTDIVFFQGSQDPWQWAGVRHTLSSKEVEYTMVCDNCGHGCDIRGCPSLPGLNKVNGCSNPDAIVQARQTTEQKIKLWLQ